MTRAGAPTLAGALATRDAALSFGGMGGAARVLATALLSSAALLLVAALSVAALSVAALSVAALPAFAGCAARLLHDTTSRSRSSMVSSSKKLDSGMEMANASSRECTNST